MSIESYDGIVTSVRLSSNPLENTYNVIDGKSEQLISEMQLELYEKVTIENGAIKSSNGMCTKEEYETSISLIKEQAAVQTNINNIKLSGKEYEKVARAIMPALSQAAQLLVRSFVSGAPIVVRFHNDGDGSAGGIAIFRALSKLQKEFFRGERNVSWQMNKSIAYTIESFYLDKMLFDSYKSTEKPLIIITDFGTSSESVDAIKLANGNCNIIWLDHHVPYASFPKEMISNYINVFDFGGDSNFTAGLMSSLFAEVVANVEVEDLKEAALISDYSAYADFKNEKGMKDSIILDFLTSTGRETYGKPKQMDVILTDKEKSESTYTHASAQLEEAILTGMHNLKNYKTSNGINVCILDFSHVAKLKFDYPLPGRYTSKLQERLETANNGSTITIVHYGNYISVRLSRDISDSVKLLEVIERMKVATNGAVSGGGHHQAASIRAARENMDEIMHLFLAELGIAQP